MPYNFEPEITKDLSMMNFPLSKAWTVHDASLKSPCPCDRSDEKEIDFSITPERQLFYCGR